MMRTHTLAYILAAGLAGCTQARADLPGWSSGGAGGGGTLNPSTLWSYAKQPASPNASDDYFADLTGITDWDEGAQCDALALDASGRGATVTINAAVGDDWCGFFTTDIPSASQWAVTVPVRVDRLAGTVVQQAGLFVGEDLSSAPSTGDIWVMSTAIGAGSAAGEISFQQWSSYTAFAATQEQTTVQDWQTATFTLMRAFVDTTAQTVEFLYSADGRAWTQFGAARSIAGQTISTIGVAGYTNGTGIDDQVLYAEFIQFSETADPYEPMGGLVVLE